MEDTDHHHHASVPENASFAFIIGIILNFLFVIIEVIIGIYVNSLSLLSDAAHNLADVAFLGLSLLAIKLVKVKPSKNYTYGYSKSSILVALLNAIVLLVSIGGIVFESIHRLLHPEPVLGNVVAIVAAIGIVINSASALLFFRDKSKDVNIKSAYLHLMSDALVSLALVIGGIIIYYTHWYIVDAFLSLVVAIVIMIGTYNLLKETFRLSLDGVPHNIDISEIRNIALKVKDVKDFHHIHIWAISTTKNALTGHLVVENTRDLEKINRIREEIKHQLQHHNIHHLTIETELYEKNNPPHEC